jgi:hypothetical protein
MASRLPAAFLVLALQAAVPGASAQEMALTLARGMSAYGYGYAPPVVHVVGGIATVSGVLKVAGGQDIAVLPAGARPKARMIFTVWSNTAPVRVDVLPDGRIAYALGPPLANYVSLSGISFPTD